MIAAPGFHARLGAATDGPLRRLQAAASAAPTSVRDQSRVRHVRFLLHDANRRWDISREVLACDTERFRRFFHAMLDAGIYLAPSAFEAGFLSAAHSDADIDATIAAAESIFPRLHAA